MKHAPPSPAEGPGAPRTSRRAAFLDSGACDGVALGDCADAAPREDTLIGTAGTHTPGRDTRAEEPFGEIAPSADAEDGVD